MATNNSEIKVELPTGYSFEVSGGPSRPLPIGIATYHCICSGGGACQVVFIEELGFGCMHSNCSGGCTGAFTYRGYSINRVVRIDEGKEKFLADPAIQKEIIGQYKLIHTAAGISSEEYAPQHIYGVTYYFQLPATASCDCDGTKACTLKTLGIAMDKTGTQSFKIYYCDGPCNGCELTVN